MNHTEIANSYAKDIVAGKIEACTYVKQACKRHLDDLEDTGSPYYFDVNEAERVCQFISMLPHTKGEWAYKREPITLEPWQKFILCVIFGWRKKDNKKRRFREAYLEVPRKNGKALALDTKIPTPDGWKLLRDIHPGDQVFDENGAVCNVVAETPVQLHRPCYKLTFSDGCTMVADAEHEWLTDTRKHRENKKVKAWPTVKTTKEISKTLYCRNERNHRIQLTSPLQLQDAPLAIDPYVLGFWLGDGTARCGQLTINAMDQAEVCTLYASRQWPLSKLKANLRFGCGGLAVQLKQSDLIQNKHIPPQYLRSSERQRMELLQGLMDSDGYCSKQGQCEFSTTSPELRDGFLELARGLGYKPTLKTIRAMLNGKDCGEAYRIQFWAYKDRPVFKVKRKAARLKQAPGSPTRSNSRTIISCDLVESVPVKCIQVDSPSHLYLAGEGFVPTHNSILSAAVCLYCFCMDNEFGAECYTLASTENQAWEVYRPAKLMVQRTPMLAEAKGIQVNAKTMTRAEDGSRFAPLIGNPGDGQSPHLAVIDELHQLEYDSISTMTTGMGARSQPLLFMITTAGSNIEGICYQKRAEVITMLEGSVPNESMFGMIYTLDADDDWTDPKVLKKCNPNMGVSVYEDYLINQQIQATKSTPRQNPFKTKHLNVWVSARDAWINMAQWNKMADKHLKLEDFEGQTCFIAVDLASKVDLCAIILIFPRQIDGKRHYFVFADFYLPHDTIFSSGSKNAKIYQKWLNDGHLIATHGAEVDYNFIRDEILENCARFDVREIPHDPWNCNQLAQQLMDEGLTPVKIPQTTQYLSHSMKEIEGAVASARLHHNGDPVLTWCMSNVTVKPDAKDQIFPRKERMESKIDGAVALITGMNRAMIEDDGLSAYETEKLLVL